VGPNPHHTQPSQPLLLKNPASCPPNWLCTQAFLILYLLLLVCAIVMVSHGAGVRNSHGESWC